MVLLPLIFLCIQDHIFGCWHLTLRAKACFRWGWDGVGGGGEGWWGVWGDLVEGSEVVAETAGGGKRMWSHSPRKEASHCGPESKSESWNAKVKATISAEDFFDWYPQWLFCKFNILSIHMGATYCHISYPGSEKVVFVNYCCEDTGDCPAVLSRAIFLLPSASQAASYWASNT